MLKKLIRYKVYFDRARIYLGYAQFIMMLLVFLKIYEKTKLGQWFFSNIWFTFPLFILMFFGISIIVGYLDKKYIRPYETTEINKVNPEFMEMYNTIMKLQ